MKLSIILIFITTLSSIAADSYSQSTLLDLKMENASVKDVLDQIEAQSEFRFFYSGNVDLERTTSFTGRNKKVIEILDEVFEGTDVNYNIGGRQIALFTKSEISEATFLQDTKTITGVITDESGQPLPSVTVLQKGTTNATISDMNGAYVLAGVSDESVLKFSFIGMETQEILVGDQSSINVTLTNALIAIDEVIAIGYGIVRKVDITGAVSSVSSDELTKISTTSTAQTLQGRMTGVQVTSNNGEPGSGSTIKIRGIGSIRSDNSPLILIDGYPGSIEDVLPNDIESVSVLKDAAAASIYGARAANGVILITTKRGVSGKMEVEVTAEHGISTLTKRPEFMNAMQWGIKANERKLWIGRTPLFVDEYAPELLGEGTDWFDYVYTQGTMDKYHIGLRGGNENSKFALSAGYLDQQGLIKNTSYNKFQTRVNFDHKFNKWVSVGANYSLSRDHSYDGNENIWGDGIKYNGYGLAVAAHRTSPTVPAYFEDGSLGIYSRDFPGEKPANGTLPPTWYFGNKDENKVNLKNRSSMFAEITFFEGFKFKSIVNAYQGSGYGTHFHDTWEAYIPGEDIPVQLNSINALNTNSSSAFGWEVQQLLTFDRKFGNHSVSALAGFSAEKFTSEWMNLTSQGFLGNSLHVADAGSEVVSSGGSKTVTAYESLFGRINYDYGGRYLLQGTVRRDGSSAFAPGNQYGIFPSVSGAWRISQEDFMQNQNLFSSLKIRAGYGQLGNANIPSFKWISTLRLTDGHPFGGGFPQVYQPAYYITEMENKQVKWETTTTLDIGLDFAFVNNQLSFELDYYDKSTTDLLWPATIPQTAGKISGPMVNLGEISNKGMELTVHWVDNIGGFNYEFSGNISRNKNLVVDMGNIPEQLNDNIMIKEGYPLNSFWGYKVDGIWRTWDELDNNPHRTGDIRPGDFRFLDINGADEDGNVTGEPDGVINSYDMTYLGDPIPDLYYGFSGYASYKGFDVSFLMNGELGKQTMVSPSYGGAYGGGNNVVDHFLSRAILDENGEVISGTTNATGADPGGESEAVMHDISYLRIKNLQMGYSFSKGLLSKIKVSSVRLYVSATNPFLFTDYVGWDQESSDLTTARVSLGGNQYVPVSKTLTMGLSVKF